MEIVVTWYLNGVLLIIILKWMTESSQAFSCTDDKLIWVTAEIKDPIRSRMLQPPNLDSPEPHGEKSMFPAIRLHQTYTRHL